MTVGGARVRSWALEAESDDEDDGGVLGSVREKKASVASRPAPTAAGSRPRVQWDKEEPSEAEKAKTAALLAQQLQDAEEALEIEDDLEAEDLEDADMW